MSISNRLGTLMNEAKWSGKVEEKWHPAEGFFEKSAEKIASGLKSASKDLKQAMSRLNFYINRAGKNLSAEDKARLENAKEKLHASYTTNEGATKKKAVAKTIDNIVTAKDSEGKEFHVIEISLGGWVTLIPSKGKYSDKKTIPVGDFYEEYTAYDSKGKVVHSPDDIEEAVVTEGAEKITISLLRKLRASNKKNLHPQEWHDFQNLPEVEALDFALHNKNNPEDTDADIVKHAKEYYKSMNESAITEATSDAKYIKAQLDGLLPIDSKFGINIQLRSNTEDGGKTNWMRLTPELAHHIVKFLKENKPEETEEPKE